MILEADLLNYDEEDFCDIVEARYGGSVGAQARDIFAGEDLEKQNPAALECIADLARLKGEKELANELKEYLKNIYKGVES